MQIRIEGLTKKYGSMTALDDLNLILEDISSLAVIGPQVVVKLLCSEFWPA
jgi:ABC-type branched-subunit amino acid transport system ATPase component